MQKLLIWTLMGAAVAAAAGDQWNVAFSRETRESRMAFDSIAFPSARRGIAIGWQIEKDRPRPVAVVTSDGGSRWDIVRLKDPALSLFCLNDSLCWTTAEKGVWQTEESGRTWRKISGQKGLLRVYFDSPEHGFAAGLEKSIYETRDGGKSWTKLAITDEIEAKAQHAAFTTIGFDGGIGLIAGVSEPPRRTRESIFPSWMEPEKVAKKLEWPHLFLLAETKNGGEKWRVAVTSVFGKVTAIRLNATRGDGFALFEYSDTFDFPSEVLRLDLTSGKSAPVYRRKEHAVTDIQRLGPNRLLLAGTDTQGLKVRSLPVPSPLKIGEMEMDDQGQPVRFIDHQVSYKARGKRVTTAKTPEGQLWAVTDTGLILRLDRAPGKR